MRLIIFILSLIFSISSFAQSSSDLYAEAIKFAEKKKYKKALENIDRAIVKSPFNARFFEKRSIYCLYLSNWEESLGSLHTAIHLMPDSTGLYITRANIYDILNQFKEAELDFTAAIEIAKTDSLKSDYYMLRGGYKSKYRNYVGAELDLLKSLEINPKNLGALNNMAMVMDRLGKKEEGFAYLERVIKSDPNFIPGYINLGFKYQQIGNHNKAIKYFHRAIKISPNEPLIYSNMSFSKLQKGNIRGALKDINRSIKLYPANSWAYKTLGQILIKKGKTKDACENFYRAIELGYELQYGDEVQELIENNCNEISL